MKRANKLIAMLLILTMTLALTGCASGDYKKAAKSLENGDYAAAAEGFRALGDYKDSAELLARAETELIRERVTGNWLSVEMDMSQQVLQEAMADMGEEAEEFARYFDLKDFCFAVEAEFNQNGTVSFAVSEESLAGAAEALKQCLKAGFEVSLTEMLQQTLAEEGITMEVLEAMMGVPVTAETLLSIMGVSVDEMVDELLEDENIMDVSEFTGTGTWDVVDGRIVISDGSENEYAQYDIDKDELTFTDGDNLESFYPLTFRRAQ